MLNNPNVRNVPSEPEKKSALKNPMVYSSLIVLIVALYVGWILFSRWQEARSLQEKEHQEQAQKQHEADEAAIEQLGGNELAIQTFYAGPTKIKRGETVQICYGVANAKTVTLTPQKNEVWPSHNRCVEDQPMKTTTYTLTATDAEGHSVSQTATIEVH